MAKVSIVIPCYNEADNIPLILERFQQVLHGEALEVVLVDNGSTDQSAQVIMQLLPKYPFARTVRVPVNQGYGYGILQGLNSCTTPFVGWTHADMQTDPQDVVLAYHMLEENQWSPTLYIKGRRTDRPFFDVLFTFGMSIFETLYLRTPLYDINAQPNLFSAEFFSKWHSPPYDFALDLYAFCMARRQGCRVLRFRVRFPERIHGSSHWNTGLRSKWKFIKRTLQFSRSLKKAGIQ